MMRAAIASRVSTKAQAERDRYSLSYQRDLMEQVCARKGWPIVKQFEVPGESAYKWRLSERPEFEAIVNAGARREYDVLVLYDLSRLARNQAAGHDVRRIFHENGIAGWSASGDYDWVENSQQAGLDLMVAEQASKDASRRLLSAMQRKHSEGLHVGHAPFGYAFDGAQLVIVPEEAEAVRRAYADRILGAGYAEIATSLNVAGLAPHSQRGRTWWAEPSVQVMLHNRTYTGQVVHKRQWVEGRHEAIIPPDQWEAAQQVSIAKPHRSRAPWLLSGIAQCRHCDGALWQQGGSPRGHRYYRDSAVHRREQCRTAGAVWRADDPEAIAREVVVSLAVDEEWLASVQRDARKLPEPRRDELGELQRLKAVENDIYRSGGSREEWLARTAVLDARIRASQPEPREILGAAERLRDLGMLWDGASLDWQRKVLRTLFTAVPLALDERKLWVEPRDRGVTTLLQHRADWLLCGDGLGSRRHSPHNAHFESTELVRAS